jgi:hypothetical protein
MDELALLYSGSAEQYGKHFLFAIAKLTIYAKQFCKESKLRKRAETSTE